MTNKPIGPTLSLRHRAPIASRVRKRRPFRLDLAGVVLFVDSGGWIHNHDGSPLVGHGPGHIKRMFPYLKNR